MTAGRLMWQSSLANCIMILHCSELPALFIFNQAHQGLPLGPACLCTVREIIHLNDMLCFCAHREGEITSFAPTLCSADTLLQQVALSLLSEGFETNIDQMLFYSIINTFITTIIQISLLMSVYTVAQKGFELS